MIVARGHLTVSICLKMCICWDFLGCFVAYPHEQPHIYVGQLSFLLDGDDVVLRIHCRVQNDGRVGPENILRTSRIEVRIVYSFFGKFDSMTGLETDVSTRKSYNIMMGMREKYRETYLFSFLPACIQKRRCSCLAARF